MMMFHKWRRDRKQNEMCTKGGKEVGKFFRKLCVIMSWACDRFWYESSARERLKLTAIQMRARRYLNFLSHPTYFTRVCVSIWERILCAYSRRMWFIRVMIKRDLEKFFGSFLSNDYSCITKWDDKQWKLKSREALSVIKLNINNWNGSLGKHWAIISKYYQEIWELEDIWY